MGLLRSIGWHSCLNIYEQRYRGGGEKQERRKTIRGKNIWGGWIDERGRVKGGRKMWEGTYQVWWTGGEGVPRGLRRETSHPILRWACAIELERWKGIRDKWAGEEDVVSFYLRGNDTPRLVDEEEWWKVFTVHSALWRCWYSSVQCWPRFWHGPSCLLMSPKSFSPRL